jgi:septal ring factor EnvC (AmiA/AmiB activator)
MYDLEFCVPFQEQYENMVPDEARARYAMVIDGEVMDGKRVKYLTKDAILAKEYLSEIQELKKWIEAHKIQIDGLQHDLETTRLRLSQAPVEATALTDQANGHKARIDDLQHQLPTTETVQMRRSAFARAVLASLQQQESFRQ